MQIYKSGQGTKARWIAALSAVAIAVFGIYEAWMLWMASVPFYIAVAVMAGVALGGVYLAMVNVRTSEFLIETQAELKKVAWPPKTEVKGSTAVVVATVVAFSIFLYIVDYFLALVTHFINVY